MTATRRPRWAGPTIPALGLTLAAFGLYLRRPIIHTTDDDLFYVVVARNILDGHGITFSRLMHTNGVQPLWQAIVTLALGLGRVVGVDTPSGELVLTGAAYYACLAIAVVQWERLTRQLGLRPFVRAVGAVALVLYLIGASGVLVLSEAALVAVVLLWFLRRLHAYLTDPGVAAPLSVIGTGAVGGLVFLARLDTGFVLLAAAVFVVIVRRTQGARELTRDAGLGLAGAAAVAGPYLLWNVLAFGHLVPIAGAIKVDATDPHLQLRQVGTNALVLLVIAAIAFVVVSISVVPGLRRGSRTILAILLTGSAAASTWYLVAGQDFSTAPIWYHVPQAVAAALGASMVLQLLAYDRPWLRTAVAIGTAVIVLAAGVLMVRRTTGYPWTYAQQMTDFTDVVREEVPPGSPLLTIDFPGVIAFDTDLRVVGLDGLTGDFAFQDALAHDGIACVAEDLGIRYVVTYDGGPARPTADGTYELPVVSHLHREPAGIVRLRPEDRIAVVGPKHRTLWRYEPDCPTG